MKKNKDTVKHQKQRHTESIRDIQTVTCGQRGFLSPCEKITEKGRAEEEGEEGRFQKGKKKGKGKLRRKGKEI